MAKHTVDDGKLAAHNKLLTLNTVDSVAFAVAPEFVEVLTDGVAAIYVTTDGTEPTVGGANTYVLPPVRCSRIIRHGGDKPVKLISAGTPTYSVTVIGG